MTIDVGETEEEMNNTTVLQLKQKISQRLPGWDIGRQVELYNTELEQTYWAMYIMIFMEFDGLSLGKQGNSRHCDKQFIITFIAMCVPPY